MAETSVGVPVMARVAPSSASPSGSAGATVYLSGELTSVAVSPTPGVGNVAAGRTGSSAHTGASSTKDLSATVADPKDGERSLTRRSPRFVNESWVRASMS